MAQGSVSAGSHLEKSSLGMCVCQMKALLSHGSKLMLEHGVGGALKRVLCLVIGEVHHILTKLLEILFLLATSPNILIKQRCSC